MKINKLKNYIVFWLSQSISQLGSSMTSFTLVIWAYKQTNSAMTVSLITFSYYLPYIVVSIFAGAFIDNHKKRTIILCSDCIAAMCSMVVLILTFVNKLEIVHIYMVNFIVGFMNSFQSPAESITISILVPKDKYFKISGLNSFSNSLLAVVTPMLAVFISSFMGLQGVIIIDLITFIFAFTVLLIFIKIPEKINRQCSILYGCKEGILFLLNHKGIFYIIISMVSLNFFSRLTYENILSPMILARSGGNTYVLGIVSGILGIGGIIGGIVVSTKKIIDDNVKLIYFSAAFSFLFGDLLMGLGQTLFIWCIAAIMASVPIPFISAGQNVIIYNTIPKEIQRRVFAVRNTVQFCTIPIGIILGGFLSDYIFEPFMKSNNIVALNLQKVVGYGAGSGMAVMFLFTGILGAITSILWYKNKDIQDINSTL